MNSPYLKSESHWGNTPHTQPNPRRFTAGQHKFTLTIRFFFLKNAHIFTPDEKIWPQTSNMELFHFKRYAGSPETKDATALTRYKQDEPACTASKKLDRTAPERGGAKAAEGRRTGPSGSGGRRGTGSNTCTRRRLSNFERGVGVYCLQEDAMQLVPRNP